MELIGNNIILRNAQSSDVENIYKHIWSDLIVAETMFFPPCSCLDEAYDRMTRTIKYQQENDAFFVALKSTNEAIGIAGIKLESEGVYSECGIGIGRAYQNKGIGKEVLQLLLKLAFSKEDCKVFAYYCMEHNERSKHLAKSFHFIYDKTEVEVRKYDNKSFPIERYLLTKEEYFSLQK